MADLKTPEELQAEINSLTDKLSVADTALAEANETIETLNGVIATAQEAAPGAAEKPAAKPLKLVKHDKKTYKWALPVFNLGGTRYEAASASKETIEELLALEGQGILVEQS